MAKDSLGSFKCCHQRVLQLTEEDLIWAINKDEAGHDAIRL